MGSMNGNRLNGFLRLSRPFFLMIGALAYALGAGIAKYLGHSINWDVYFMGQVWITSVQLSAQYLDEYLNVSVKQHPPLRTRTPSHDAYSEKYGLSKTVLMYLSIVMLTLTTTVTASILRSGMVEGTSLMVMLIVLAGTFCYSLPPLNLSEKGYGELLLAVLVANMIPAFAFLLQTGELHRLVFMSTFPLTFSFLAMMIVYEFRDYAVDMKKGRSTLLIRLGWQKSIVVHNILVLTAFLVLGLATLAGLSLSISFPGMLIFPLGLFQIWYLAKIADGIKPQWNVFIVYTIAMFALFIYLLAFAFWTH